MKTKNMLAAVGIVGLCLSIGGTCRGAQPPGQPGAAELLAVRVLLEDQLWRVGGPDQGRIVSLYKRLAKIGDPAIVGEASSAVCQMLRHQWLDQTAAAALQEVRPIIVQTNEPRGGTDPTLALLGCIKTRLVSAETRRAEYRAALSVEPESKVAGLSWGPTLASALVEEADDLLPAIQQALSIGRVRERLDGYTVSYLDQVLIPLAEARRSGDWVKGYCALLQESAQSNGLTVGDDRLRASARNRLILLRLIHVNPPGLSARLDAIAEAIKLPPSAFEEWRSLRFMTDKHDVQALLARALTVLRASEGTGASAAAATKPSAPAAVWAEKDLLDRGLLAKD